MAQLRLVVEIYHYLQGFSTIHGGCLGFLNHQQYHGFWSSDCTLQEVDGTSICPCVCHFSKAVNVVKSENNTYDMVISMHACVKSIR